MIITTNNDSSRGSLKVLHIQICDPEWHHLFEIEFWYYSLFFRKKKRLTATLILQDVTLIINNSGCSYEINPLYPQCNTYAHRLFQHCKYFYTESL